MYKDQLRFRQVHLDFHTSGLLEDIGAEFDAEEFASTLEKARVDSVTCFARCHHGLAYFDSKKFPETVHPHLKNKNLLKEQIEACHKHGIRVPIYTTVQWDDYMAKEHPEWLTMDEKGKVISWNSTYEPGFYRFLCLNSPYREYLKQHTKEILDTFDPVDGLFFDILFTTDCSCRHCREKMEQRGYEPLKKDDRLKFASETLNEFMLEMSAYIREYNKTCSIFYNSSHVGPAFRKRLDAFTHLELESLPSGGWGYLHFPITVRYARTLGPDCMGMTGKFHTDWGDFHSFKNRAALEYECFRMLALNARCSVGDQLEPSGRLSAPVYDLIGSVYSSVEKKEPWCVGAASVTDIGVMTPEEFTYGNRSNLSSATMGITQMLQESGHQFDIIDSLSDFSPYKVLVMPDYIPISSGLNEKLENYLKNGGKVIASFESGMDEGVKEFVFKAAGVRLKDTVTLGWDGLPARGRKFERSAFADYLLPAGELAKGLPETEHVMYLKGMEVEAEAGSEVLAKAILPFFNRTYKHFSSHRQAPSSGRYGYDGIVRNGNVIYFAHPVFTQYEQNAPLWCKRLFLNALELLLPEPLVRHDGPSTLQAELNEQKAENRWVLHLLHYIPQRRCQDIDIIEDIIPLYNLKLSVKVPQRPKRVVSVPDGRELPFSEKDGRLEFLVERLEGHGMTAIEF